MSKLIGYCDANHRGLEGSGAQNSAPCTLVPKIVGSPGTPPPPLHWNLVPAFHLTFKRKVNILGVILYQRMHGSVTFGFRIT